MTPVRASPFFVVAALLVQGSTALQISKDEASHSHDEDVDAKSKASFLREHAKLGEIGCYIYLPTGCARRKNFKTPEWTKDPNGAKFHAHASSAACESRKAQYNHWCGVTDTEVLFLVDTVEAKAFVEEDVRPLALRPEAPYTKSGLSTDQCPAGKVAVNDVTECESAGNSLGFPWRGTSTLGDWPQGCIYNDVIAFGAYFNTVSGTTHSQGGLICKQEQALPQQEPESNSKLLRGWMSKESLYELYGAENAEVMINAGFIATRRNPDIHSQIQYAKDWVNEDALHEIFEKSTIKKLLKNGVLSRRKNPDVPGGAEYAFAG